MEAGARGAFCVKAFWSFAKEAAKLPIPRWPNSRFLIHASLKRTANLDELLVIDGSTLVDIDILARLHRYPRSLERMLRPPERKTGESNTGGWGGAPLYKQHPYKDLKKNPESRELPICQRIAPVPEALVDLFDPELGGRMDPKPEARNPEP